MSRALDWLVNVAAGFLIMFLVIRMAQAWPGQAAWSAIVLAGLWAFFGFYTLVMGLYRAWLRGGMPWPIKLLGLPFVLVGGLLDVFFNLTVFSLVLLEPPREWLVTGRLSRLEQDAGWRGEIARWICANLLDPLDPTGEHCHPGQTL